MFFVYIRRLLAALVLLAALCYGGAPVAAQDANTQPTLRLPAPSNGYRFFTIDGYESKIDADGNITARAVLESQFLALPDKALYTYGPFEPVDPAHKDGILGRDMRNLSSSPLAKRMDLNGKGELSNHETLNEQLFNSVRDALPREAQKAIRDSAVADPKSFYTLWFGDSLANSREARRLAYEGKMVINGGGTDLATLAKYHKLIKDPRNPGTSNDRDDLSLTTLQDDSLWFFEMCDVKPKGLTLPNTFPKIKVFRVRVQWVLELKAPANPFPALPLPRRFTGAITLTQPNPSQPDTDNSQTQPAGTDQVSTSGAQNGGGAAASFLSSFLPGLVPTGVPQGNDTLVPVTGVAVLNNASATILGLNIVIVNGFNKPAAAARPAEPSASVPGAAAKPSRKVRMPGLRMDNRSFGILVAKAQQGNKDYILAPSLGVTPYASLYFGIASSTPQGNQRIAPAFGASIGILNLIDRNADKKAKGSATAVTVIAPPGDLPPDERPYAPSTATDYVTTLWSGQENLPADTETTTDRYIAVFDNTQYKDTTVPAHYYVVLRKPVPTTPTPPQSGQGGGGGNAANGQANGTPNGQGAAAKPPSGQGDGGSKPANGQAGGNAGKGQDKAGAGQGANPQPAGGAGGVAKPPTPPDDIWFDWIKPFTLPATPTPNPAPEILGRMDSAIPAGNVRLVNVLHVRVSIGNITVLSSLTGDAAGLEAWSNVNGHDSKKLTVTNLDTKMSVAVKSDYGPGQIYRFVISE